MEGKKTTTARIHSQYFNLLNGHRQSAFRTFMPFCLCIGFCFTIRLSVLFCVFYFHFGLSVGITNHMHKTDTKKKKSTKRRKTPIRFRVHISNWSLQNENSVVYYVFVCFCTQIDCSHFNYYNSKNVDNFLLLLLLC